MAKRSVTKTPAKDRVKPVKAKTAAASRATKSSKRATAPTRKHAPSKTKSRSLIGRLVATFT